MDPECGVRIGAVHRLQRFTQIKPEPDRLGDDPARRADHGGSRFDRPDISPDTVNDVVTALERARLRERKLAFLPKSVEEWPVG
jgi:hypothetical protein